MRDYRNISSPAGAELGRGKPVPARQRRGEQRRESRPRPPRPEPSSEDLARRDRRLALAVRAGALLLLVAGLWLALPLAGAALAAAPLFRVSSIQVSGLAHVARAEVLASAGLAPGQSLVNIEIREIARKLQKNPWFKRVAVRRVWPATIIISVTEREPVAIVSLRYLYYLDRDGEVFKPLAPGDRLDYPVVTVTDESVLAADNKQLVRQAVALLDELKTSRHLSLAQVSEIRLEKNNGYTLYTETGGIPVAIGSDDFAAKLARAARVYASLDPQTVASIDANYPDKVIVAWRAPQPAIANPPPVTPSTEND